jgi:hypothetical protein
MRKLRTPESNIKSRHTLVKERLRCDANIQFFTRHGLQHNYEKLRELSYRRNRGYASETSNWGRTSAKAKEGKLNRDRSSCAAAAG